MTQLRWLPVGWCLTLGIWLAAVSVAFMDSLGFAVALVALLFGAVYVPPH